MAFGCGAALGLAGFEPFDFATGCAGPDLTTVGFADVRCLAFDFAAAFFLPALGFLADRFDVFLAVSFFDVLAVRFLAVRLRAVLRAAAFFFALRAGTAFLVFLLFDLVFLDFVFLAMPTRSNGLEIKT